MPCLGALPVRASMLRLLGRGPVPPSPVTLTQSCWARNPVAEPDLIPGTTSTSRKGWERTAAQPGLLVRLALGKNVEGGVSLLRAEAALGQESSEHLGAPTAPIWGCMLVVCKDMIPGLCGPEARNHRLGGSARGQLSYSLPACEDSVTAPPAAGPASCGRGRADRIQIPVGVVLFGLP